MTRTESFVPRETHFRSPFEASRPHLRAQSHSFIFYQARASASCPPLPPFSNPTRARASLFLRDGTSHHRRLLGQISISDSSFARKISRDNAFNVSRDVLSRDQTLSSRKQGRDPKGFLLLTDPPSRYTLEPPFPLSSPQMAPSSTLLFFRENLVSGISLWAGLSLIFSLHAFMWKSWMVESLSRPLRFSKYR